MTARLVDSDITKLVVVPGGVANVNAPTVEEFNSGIDITCAVVAGYTLGFTDSNTIEGRSVCDTGNVVNYASANYEGNLQFFVEADEDETEEGSAYLRAENFFTDRNIKFDLIRRIGKSHDEEGEAGDKVEVFGFVTDYQQRTSGADGDAYATFTQPLGQQSRFSKGPVALVAG